MGVPISIRLDDDVRSELERQAERLGMGLGVFLRDMATQAAREARYARIREAGEAVARRVAASAEARALFEEWGTPNHDVG